MDSGNSFEQDGFVKVPGFCAGEDLAFLETELEEFIQSRLDSLPPELVFYEDKSRKDSLKQIQQLHQYSVLFHQWMTNQPQGLAEALLGEPVRAMNLQYFNKAPGMSRPTPPHQDGYYFMLEPCRAITLWLALDAVDEGNGCVRYVRGSHRGGLRTHRRTNTLGFSQGIADYGAADAANEVACAAGPGDVLAHHALTIHRADGNQSVHRQRRSLGLIFYGRSAQEDAAAHAANQEQLTQEMKAAGRI